MWGVRWGEATAGHSSATSDVQDHQQTLPKLWAQKANEILLRMDHLHVHLPRLSSPALLLLNITLFALLWVPLIPSSSSDPLSLDIYVIFFFTKSLPNFDVSFIVLFLFD